MTDPDPRLADLLSLLRDRLDESDRPLADEVAAAVMRQTGTLDRECRQLRRAAVEYRSERDILRLVAGVPEAGASAQSPQEFVDAAVRAIEQMPRVEHGWVVLFDDDGRPAVLETIRVDEDDRRLLDEQISAGIVARVRDEGKEIYCEKATEDRVFGGLESVRAYRMQTVLCCPIPGAGAGTTRGAVYVENRSRPAAFPPAWREAVRMLAAQMAQQIALLERAGTPGDDPTAPYRRHGRYHELVGRSRLTGQLLAQLDRITSERQPPSVLIMGETGVGKELVAWSLHRYGPRREGPFVPVNAAALPPSLAESELFGSRKGAFTDAVERRGLFREADGGILFLDEIGDLSAEIQAKLLRVLDDGRVRPVGGGEYRVDTWIVAATNVDLRRAVEEGRFRQDLYYRLTETLVYVTPLRERPDDVELLAEYFVSGAAERQGVPAPVLSPDLLVALRARSWPGNVRELRATVERLVRDRTGPVLTIDDLRVMERAGAGGQGIVPGEIPPAGTVSGDGEGPEVETWEVVTRRFHGRYLRLAIERWGPSPQRVAERLGIHRTYLYKLMRKHGIDHTRARRRAARSAVAPAGDG